MLQWLMPHVTAMPSKDGGSVRVPDLGSKLQWLLQKHGWPAGAQKFHFAYVLQSCGTQRSDRRQFSKAVFKVPLASQSSKIAFCIRVAILRDTAKLSPSTFKNPSSKAFARRSGAIGADFPNLASKCRWPAGAQNAHFAHILQSC